MFTYAFLTKNDSLGVQPSSSALDVVLRLARRRKPGFGQKLGIHSCVSNKEVQNYYNCHIIIIAIFAPS